MDHPFKSTVIAGKESSVGTPAAKTSSVNFYQIINASPEASPRAIREAYIRTKSGFSASQDVTYSLFSNEDLQKTLQEIDEAFRVLSDPTSKARYDISIGLQPGREFSSPPTFGETDKAKRPSFGVSAFSGLGEGRQSLKEPDAVYKSNEEFDIATGLHLFEAAVKNEAPAEKSVQFTTPLTVKSKRKFEDVDGEVLEELIGQLSDPASTDFGLKLVSLRELFGVSQEEIIDRTKINITYIVALEGDHLADMPKPIYTKGFLRNYLKYLGIQNIEPIVTAYMSRFAV